MRFTKRTVLTANATTPVVGLVITVCLGVGIVKLWPVASARQVVAQGGVWLGEDRIVQLSRTGEGIAALAGLAGNRELAELRKWDAAIPALAPLVQNGSYQKALEETVRQNAASIGQIRLDQVASAEVRAMIAEVQQVVAKNLRESKPRPM
jgi:hypothetical protein